MFDVAKTAFPHILGKGENRSSEHIDYIADVQSKEPKGLPLTASSFNTAYDPSIITNPLNWAMDKMRNIYSGHQHPYRSWEKNGWKLKHDPEKNILMKVGHSYWDQQQLDAAYGGKNSSAWETLKTLPGNYLANTFWAGEKEHPLTATEYKLLGLNPIIDEKNLSIHPQPEDVLKINANPSVFAPKGIKTGWFT